MGTAWRRMTKRRTKKRKSDTLLAFRQPLHSSDYLSGMRRILPLLVLIWTAGAIAVSPVAGNAQNQAGSHAHDFVIFTTVFTQQGFALPGARVRVRQADEKKFRWEAMSDRRGELGIRVKQGSEYEMTIEARGFKPQTRKIDAREGDRKDITLQMEPLAGGKP